MDKCTYMFERNYCQKVSVDNRDEKKLYWEKILGKEVYETANINGRLDDFLGGDHYSSSIDLENTYIWKCLIDNRFNDHDLVLEKQFLEDKFAFCGFYIPFVKIAENMLLRNCKNNRIFLDNKSLILKEFEIRSFEKIADCSIRMLIMEMNFCKLEGNLKGGEPEKEYEDYIKNWINNRAYFMELLNAYPALLRLLIDVIDNMVAFYTEILENFLKDEGVIQKAFGYNTAKFMKFTVGGSDSHVHGKSVAIIRFNDDNTLVYKPHSIKAELIYQDFLEWLGEKTDLRMKTYKILDRRNYGWEEFVRYVPCESEDELIVYYKRLGLIICANYMLNVYDIHNENIIASGAYPIVIDAETLLKNYEPFDHNNIVEVALNEIRGTVMAQGILPQYMKRKNGKQSIDVSGMANDVGKEYPRKVPMIIHSKRSDMKCVYVYPKEVEKQNLPILKNNVKYPIHYVDYILDGFDRGYKFALANKKLIGEKYNTFSNLRLRHLCRNTQTYSMLLTTSKHPDFLGDCASRQMILMALYKNRNLSSTSERLVIEDEILQMLYNDIPMFTYDSNGKDLISGYGNCIKGYFEKSAIEIIKEKLENMNNPDLLKQKLYIVLSVSSTEDINEEKSRQDKEQRVPLLWRQEFQSPFKKESVFENCRSIVEKLKENAIYNAEKTKIGWIGISLMGVEEIHWNVVPLNYDLYNGIGGIAVFLHAFCKTYKDSGYDDLCLAIDNSLDEYLLSILEYDSKVGNENVSGYYSGECSLLNVFLILFQITANEKYLNKAEKLFIVVNNQITSNRTETLDNDIIAGLAGTIITLLKLYRFTGKHEYLEASEKAGEQVLKNAIKGDIGIGWTIPGQPHILAGFSHGASGIVLALMKLGKITGKQNYIKAAEAALYEEDSMYSDKFGNWVDRRMFRGTTGEQDGRNPATWCHGSGGILLARIKICSLVSPELYKTIKNDIKKAYISLSKFGGKRNQCLCHGNMGNLEILYEYAKYASDFQLERELNGAVQKAMENASYYWDCGLLPNYEHLGFMLGITGIGYSLLRRINKELPCILALE